MKRFFSLAFLFAAAACSSAAPEDDENVAASSEEAFTLGCGWLAGGSSCSELPPGDWTSPYFWADFYLAKYHSHLEYAKTHIEPGPTPLAKRRPVLLITGVTIKAAWFEPIVARLKRDGFDPVVYEPPNLLSGDLVQNSKALNAVIEKIRKDSGVSKVDILAECTGGLIARHYIQSLGGEAKVSRLVTFVSPQHGIAAVPFVRLFANWPALRDLSPGSSFLHAVNDRRCRRRCRSRRSTRAPTNTSVPSIRP